MKLSDFDYNLSEERIASYPATDRSSSRLMVLERANGTIEHRRFSDITEYLDEGDVLILNDTRVIPARLTDFEVEERGRIHSAEVLLLREIERNCWECLVKPGRRLKVGTRLYFDDGKVQAELVSKTDFGGRVIRFHIETDINKALDRIGQIPLPPYIKRPPVKELDPIRYQTVYARQNGSVAAPTAGLHFTTELLAEIRARGVSVHSITLHVGLGTFRPVRVENIAQHRMHSEYFSIDQSTAVSITAAKKEGRKVVAVGTTTVRSLESAIKDDGTLEAVSDHTSLFIYPGYRFKCVDKMVTNFHLPRSTLLMMVSAFAGTEKIMAAYAEAIRAKYRFYSYGDAMFIQ